MQLSLRLSAIAEMVTEGNRLVDVGCDHGYLPVYLILNKKIPGAIATDVRKGPLSRADEHIAQFGLTKYIETRLCDGLAGVQAGEGDTLVIAGMGGPLMERILTAGAHALPGFQELILQPQSDIPHFRRFLFDMGYVIVQEKMIQEDGKFYPMMKAVSCEKLQNEADFSHKSDWTEEEIWFGKFLLEEKNPVLREYLERELRLKNEILSKLQGQTGEMAQKRGAQIEEEKQLILAAWNRYESERTDGLS